MKKNILLIFVIPLLCALVLSFYDKKVASAAIVEDVESYKHEEQLLKDFQTFWTKFSIELDDIIYEYYGTYDECVVVWMSTIDMLDNAMIKEVPIGNYVFKFSSASASNRFYVYKDNTFTLVKDAYKNGWLSEEDIVLLADRYNKNSNIGHAYLIDICLHYKDVRFDDWFHSCIDKVYEEKLMTGMSENIFGPYEVLSRAQFATILSRMEELQPVPYDDIFKDVVEGEWYTEAVLWAAENDIVTGYENGCFGPADTITREQMAVMLYRYAKLRGYDIKEIADLKEYPDASDVSDFAKEAVSWCVAEGVISGNDGKLLPQGNTTRAECAAMITRFVGLYE